MRPSAPPVLVAAPVELTLEVPAVLLDDLFRWAAPRLSGEVGVRMGSHGCAYRGRPMLGHLEVDARLDGSTLWLRPRVLVVREYRWTLPARTPAAYPVALPELPHGLALTAITFAPDMVCVFGDVAGMADGFAAKTPGERGGGELSVAGVPLNLSRLGRLF